MHMDWQFYLYSCGILLIKKTEDDLLLCKNLELQSTGNDIFNIIDDFMKAHDISLKKFHFNLQ